MSDLDTPYPLTPEHVVAFARDGFIKLPGALSAETIAAHGPRITQATIDLNTQTLPLDERSTYDKAFLQVTNLSEHDDAIRAFVMGKRLAGIAAELLGVRGVRLYHDQSLYKEPGGGITPAHADQYYWPLATDRTVTAWIPLQAVPREMGPLAFFAGSQRHEFGRDLPISDESEAAITAEMEAQGFPVADEPFAAGEVSFHSGWIFHRAGPNRSATPRSVMTVIYMDVDMKLKSPSNAMQQADWDQWCPGAVPGEIIDTPKNPVIWERAV